MTKETAAANTLSHRWCSNSAVYAIWYSSINLQKKIIYFIYIFKDKFHVLFIQNVILKNWANSETIKNFVDKNKYLPYLLICFFILKSNFLIHFEINLLIF